jgi:hypothetical protein
MSLHAPRALRRHGAANARPEIAMTPHALLRLALVAVCAIPLLIAGCGGGVGTGGTGTYAAGPITGFGSVIVNDIRFDDRTATVVDDDGASRQPGDLRLGMTVEIDGGAVVSDANGASATATRIRFGSEIVGPVQAIDGDARTLTVLGQTVRVAVDTVFDDRLPGGLASIAVGQRVEIYAQYDAAGQAFNATRIEPRATATEWRLRAPLAALDVTARTLRIGSATFHYGAASSAPAGLAAGQVVRLRLSPAADDSGRYEVGAFGTTLQPPEDSDDASLRGRVTAMASATRFDINGLPVDASGASLPMGMMGGMRLGMRVEAKGAMVAGVLRASEIKVETDDDVRERGFELHGMIDSIDAAARTFRLRGVTVGYARADLRLEGGTVADLLQGNRQVEVKAQPSPDGTRLDAVRIKFE